MYVFMYAYTKQEQSHGLNRLRCPAARLLCAQGAAEVKGQAEHLSHRRIGIGVSRSLNKYHYHCEGMFAACDTMDIQEYATIAELVINKATAVLRDALPLVTGAYFIAATPGSWRLI